MADEKAAANWPPARFARGIPLAWFPSIAAPFRSATAAQVSRRACAPDRSAARGSKTRPAPSATQMISHSSSYPYARPEITHRDEWNVRRWTKPRLPITR